MNIAQVASLSTIDRDENVNSDIDGDVHMNIDMDVT